MPATSPQNKVASPKQPSHPPKSGETQEMNQIIDEIDDLMKKQTSVENKRQEALATTAAAHREIDLAQDLLHTSLQRIVNVDDDTFQARAVLSAKEETLNKVKAKKTSTLRERQKVDTETADLLKILEQQSSLVADLQRKLLQQGITPENILKLQKEARDKARHIVEASLPPDFSRKEQKKELPKPQNRRKAKFPTFGKAS